MEVTNGRRRVFNTLDLAANVALLPALMVAVAGVAMSSQPALRCGAVAVVIAALAKVVGFVPTWQARRRAST